MKQTAGKTRKPSIVTPIIGAPVVAAPVVIPSGPRPVFQSGLPLAPPMYRVPGIPEPVYAPPVTPTTALPVPVPVPGPIMSPVVPVPAVVSPFVPGMVVYRVRPRSPWISLFIVANGKFVFFRRPGEDVFRSFMYCLQIRNPTTLDEITIKETFNRLMTDSTTIALSKPPTFGFRIPQTQADVYYFVSDKDVENSETVLTLSPEELMTSNIIDHHSRLLARGVWLHLNRLQHLEHIPRPIIPSFYPVAF